MKLCIVMSQLTFYFLKYVTTVVYKPTEDSV